MKRLTKQEHDLLEIMRTSTDPKEIMETATKLGSTAFTLEKAKELAELNEPEKGGG